MLRKEAIDPDTLGVLEQLMQLEELSNFTLAGGTALALYWGHRLSVDIDLFTNKAFNENELFEILNEKLKLNLKNKSANYLLLDVNGVRVDIIAHRYKSIGEDAEVEGIRLASLPDILAMKLNAINNRGSKKDFFDLFFALDFYAFEELMQFFVEKYENYNQLMLLKSLTYFEDAENMANPVITRKNVSWENVKTRVSDEVRSFILQNKNNN